MRHYHKEITITLRTDELFKDQKLNQQYINQKINECLKREQPFAHHLRYTDQERAEIETSILFAKKLVEKARNQVE